jgi:protein-S-isoprenylcysteine O-methyltransferase Ste14
MELKVIPVIQVFIAALLMVTLAKSLPELSYFLDLSRPLSILLFVFATIIGGLAIYCFRQANTTVDPSRPEKASTIVDSGIYRYSRNPMYLAFLFVVLALAIYLQNIAGFLIIPVFVGYLTRFQIIPEERMLLTLFAQDYKRYCNKVRRWL